MSHGGPLVRYLQALIEGLRWAMIPQNKDEVVAMLAERLRLLPGVAVESFAIAAHPERGFTRDARFEMEGFRNVLRYASRNPAHAGHRCEQPPEVSRSLLLRESPGGTIVIA